jgi:hypothetical protein
MGFLRGRDRRYIDYEVKRVNGDKYKIHYCADKSGYIEGVPQFTFHFHVYKKLPEYEKELVPISNNGLMEMCGWEELNTPKIIKNSIEWKEGTIQERQELYSKWVLQYVTQDELWKARIMLNKKIDKEKVIR